MPFPYFPPMVITLVPQRRRVELPGPRRVADIVRQLGFLSGTVLVIRNDELISDQDLVAADDSIEIRSVISGG